MTHVDPRDLKAADAVLRAAIGDDHARQRAALITTPVITPRARR